MKSFLSKIFSKENTAQSPSAFEKRVGFTFSNQTLLKRAFTHSSLLKDEKKPYERLEFLGDAVLELAVSEYLFKNFPEEEEGYLTKLRMKYVNSKYLYKIAEDLNIADDCVVNKSVDMSNLPTRKKILSDVLEAIIGVYYLEHTMAETKNFIEKWIIKNNSISPKENKINYKGQLIEYCQKNNIDSIEFKVSNVTGPDHNREYTVTLYIQGKKYGKGKGGTKKSAEQEAADQALQKLNSITDRIK